MKFTDRLAALFKRRTSKHQTKAHGGYQEGFHNVAGTKLVRRWYGEEAARRYNR